LEGINGVTVDNNCVYFIFVDLFNLPTGGLGKRLLCVTDDQVDFSRDSLN
jgi:hypothetical protein